MYEKILEISKNLKSKFFFNYNIEKLTWFRTGGATDIYCIVENEKELEIILNSLNDIPYVVIGAGSNILIRDRGFKGIIIKLGKYFNQLSIENDKIISGASILDINLSKFALLNSIKNFEFYSGIPGSIGGAIKMNAGCFGSETKNVLYKINVMTKNGKKKILYNNDLNFSYRHSNITNEIIISAYFHIEYGDKIDIKEKINQIKIIREDAQPIKFKTSGSTFKNPNQKKAAKLIEMAGCKGLEVGGAIVSEKHSNFLINYKNASAKDIEDLGKKIIERVYNKFGIILEWEIKIIGRK
tara:strand:- start:49 stop:942 length:894 start_codon:yes stop_codon:yes gene_type:complete